MLARDIVTVDELGKMRAIEAHECTPLLWRLPIQDVSLHIDLSFNCLRSSQFPLSRDQISPFRNRPTLCRSRPLY